MARSNGFQCPLHPLQVVGWIVTLAMVVLSYTVVRPSLSPDSSIVFLCLYSPLQAIVIGLGFWLTYWDPTDPLVLAKRKGHEATPAVDNTLECADCKSSVHPDSKHCTRCDRCVQRFDHHCKWLNNCIGRDNYRWFWMLIVTLDCTAIVQFSFSIVAIVSLAKEENKEAYVQNSRDAVIAFIALAMMLDFFVCAAVSQLITLHVWLLAKGLTTYQWIKARRLAKTQVKTENKLITETDGKESMFADASKNGNITFGAESVPAHQFTMPETEIPAYA